MRRPIEVTERPRVFVEVMLGWIVVGDRELPGFHTLRSLSRKARAALRVLRRRLKDRWYRGGIRSRNRSAPSVTNRVPETWGIGSGSFGACNRRNEIIEDHACQPVPARLCFRQYRSSMIFPLPRICPLARVHSPDKDRSLRLKLRPGASRTARCCPVQLARGTRIAAECRREF